MLTWVVCLPHCWLLAAVPLGAPCLAAVANAARRSVVQESLSSGPSSSSGATSRSRRRTLGAVSTLLTDPVHHGSNDSRFPSLLCFLASTGPATTSPIWMLCKEEEWTLAGTQLPPRDAWRDRFCKCLSAQSQV
ncbi:mCG148224 [Mus musculus]|nr:mCG148224 [Mus musculus]